MKVFKNLIIDLKDVKSKDVVIILLLFILLFYLSFMNEVNLIGHDIGRALAK